MPLVKNFWLFVLWMALILYLSFAPLKDWPQPGIFQKLYLDKVVHFTMYALLSFLLLRSIFQQQLKHTPRYATIITSLIFSAGLGIAIEVLQPVFTMYRKFELMDMVANAVGAIAGVIVFKWLLSKEMMGQR